MNLNRPNLPVLHKESGIYGITAFAGKKLVILAPNKDGNGYDKVQEPFEGWEFSLPVPEHCTPVRTNDLSVDEALAYEKRVHFAPYFTTWEKKVAHRLSEAIVFANLSQYGEGCTCQVLPEYMWTTHYGSVEPGSMFAHDPECPEHGDIEDRTVPLIF